MESQIRNNIEVLRKAAKLSQDDMADMLHTNQSNYSKIERGVSSLSLNMLIRIADIFNMSLIDVITYPEKYVSQNEPILNNKTTILVELELDNKDVLAMGIKNKVIEVLNK